MQTTFNTSIGPATEFLYGRRANVRLGFGCASLMRLSSRRRRQVLLAEAFEQGIRHFDVARMYGLGAAEGELGRFARGRRDQIAIATKFGIEPPAPVMARLQAPARMLLARAPWLKAALKGRGGGAACEPRLYDARLARRSLETSLRELGTDYVDLFFVHDPAPGDQVDLDGIREACEELVRAGKIRGWGISGEPDPCLEQVGGLGSTAVPQVRDDVFAPVLPAPAPGPPAVGFGILSGVLRRIHARISADPAMRRRWSSAVGRDCGYLETISALLMEEALDRNRNGAVLVATTRLERLGPAVAAASGAADARDEHLESFRACLASDFRTPTAAARG